jgi:hypothetical protein
MSNICTICNKIYASYKSLYTHNSKYHKKDKKDVIQHTCLFCNKEFKYQSNCSRHKKTCIAKEKENDIKKDVADMKNDIKNILQNMRNNPNNIINIQQNIIVNPSLLPIHENSNMYKKINYHTYKTHIYDHDKETMLLNLIRYIYTTDNLNEYKNIYIPILHSDTVYHYNKARNTLIKGDKSTIMHKYTNSHMTCVENLVCEFDIDGDYESTVDFFNYVIDSTRHMNKIKNTITDIIHSAHETVKDHYNKYIEYTQDDVKRSIDYTVSQETAVKQTGDRKDSID